MKVTVRGHISNIQVVGTGCELADDDTWGILTLHAEFGTPDIKIQGTAKQLRELGRSIRDGFKRRKTCVK